MAMHRRFMCASARTSMRGKSPASNEARWVRRMRLHPIIWRIQILRVRPLAQTNETELKASWLDFARRLRPVGMSIFSASPIKITEQRAADIRIVGLMLLARTLSNLKATIALAESGFIVEAKVIARCCFENSYWVGALLKEGD